MTVAPVSGFLWVRPAIGSCNWWLGVSSPEHYVTQAFPVDYITIITRWMARGRAISELWMCNLRFLSWNLNLCFTTLAKNQHQIVEKKWVWIISWHHQIARPLETQEIYSQREIYINQMGVVSSILRPVPLPDLAFSTPRLNLGSKIYEVFLRGRGVLCFIIWGILHSAILPQLRHRTKKKYLASGHWIWTTSFYSHMYKSDIFFLWKALRQAKKCSRVPVRQRAGGGGGNAQRQGTFQKGAVHT